MTETNDLDAQLLAQMREDFLAESQDILDRLGPLLVQLEQEPDSDLLQTIFREVHTLKGTAGFAGFESMRLLAHRLEDVFGALRDEQLTVTPELMDVVFAGVQSLAAMREDVLRGGTGETDIDPLVARLEAALQSPEPIEGARPEPVEGRGKVLAPTPSPASQAEPGAAPSSAPRRVHAARRARDSGHHDGTGGRTHHRAQCSANHR